MTYATGPRPADAGARLLVATTNPGKIREITRVLAGGPVALATLADLAPVPEPEETGETFEANALLKAHYYASSYGLPTVAEDSGLAIDALGGRPGVLSARYPGETYAAKFANLYRELAPHHRPWTARFICALAVVEPDRARGAGHWALASAGDRVHAASASAQSPVPSARQVVFTAEATVEGEIADAPRGLNGFGYDPIFFYPPFGRTLGEATDAEKLGVSHRGQAFRQLRAWLERPTCSI